LHREPSTSTSLRKDISCRRTSIGSIFRKCAKGGVATRPRSRPSPVDRRTRYLGSRTMASDTPTSPSVVLTRAADTGTRETRSLDDPVGQADGARRNAVDRPRRSDAPARFATDPVRQVSEPRSVAVARDRQGDDRDRCSPRSPRLADGRLGPGHDPARPSYDLARLAVVSNRGTQRPKHRPIDGGRSSTGDHRFNATSGARRARRRRATVARRPPRTRRRPRRTQLVCRRTRGPGSPRRAGIRTPRSS
jgi:hypothetical protein